MPRSFCAKVRRLLRVQIAVRDGELGAADFLAAEQVADGLDGSVLVVEIGFEVQFHGFPSKLINHIVMRFSLLNSLLNFVFWLLFSKALIIVDNPYWGCPTPTFLITPFRRQCFLEQIPHLILLLIERERIRKFRQQEIIQFFTGSVFILLKVLNDKTFIVVIVQRLIMNISSFLCSPFRYFSRDKVIW